MTTIWIVTRITTQDYYGDDKEILGVFATKDGAETFVRDNSNLFRGSSYSDIRLARVSTEWQGTIDRDAVIARLQKPSMWTRLCLWIGVSRPHIQILVGNGKVVPEQVAIGDGNIQVAGNITVDDEPKPNIWFSLDNKLVYVRHIDIVYGRENICTMSYPYAAETGWANVETGASADGRLGDKLRDILRAWQLGKENKLLVEKLRKNL